jgi:DNA-binding transcriptional LysR family regulator
MEVRHLRTFCILAEELNFTRTAERVHTVQSNVTSQIKALEAEVGAPLFDRLGKRVVLTEAGRRLRPHAERALAAIDQGHRAVSFGAEVGGPLHIGTPESVLTYRLPEVLKLFRKRYPKVNLFFHPDSQERLADALESGKLDLAISMSRRFGGPKHRSLKMRAEDIYLFSVPEHPLLKAKKVYPKDLIDQNLLLTETGCGYRMMLEMQLAMAQVRPQNITEFSSIEAIKQCVAAGMGIGLLPEIAIAGELNKRQFAVLKWQGAKMSIETSVVWHADRWLSPAMQAFLDVVTATLQQTGTPTLLQERAS